MSEKTACRKAMTNTLMELAAKDKRIVAVTSDARGSATLTDYAKAYPGQFVECGIAEQNEVGVAAGLARCGKKPFVCAPAPFLSSRSLEQIKVDVAYSGTNVKIMGVSGGISYGPLGGSHYCTQDIAVMRATNGLTVMLPADARQTVWIVRQLAERVGPVYTRMGRNPVPDVYTDETAQFEWGKAKLLREGSDATVIACGEIVYYAVQAAELLAKRGKSVRVLDMYMIKPIDREAVLCAARETGGILTVEEHSVHGGLGGAVAEIIAQECPARLRIMGIPEAKFQYGSHLEMYRYLGLTPEGIAETVEELLK